MLSFNSLCVQFGYSLRELSSLFPHNTSGRLTCALVAGERANVASRLACAVHCESTIFWFCGRELCLRLTRELSLFGSCLICELLRLAASVSQRAKGAVVSAAQSRLQAADSLTALPSLWLHSHLELETRVSRLGPATRCLEARAVSRLLRAHFSPTLECASAVVGVRVSPNCQKANQWKSVEMEALSAPPDHTLPPLLRPHRRAASLSTASSPSSLCDQGTRLAQQVAAPDERLDWDATDKRSATGPRVLCSLRSSCARCESCVGRTCRRRDRGRGGVAPLSQVAAVEAGAKRAHFRPRLETEDSSRALI